MSLGLKGFLEPYLTLVASLCAWTRVNLLENQAGGLGLLAGSERSQAGVHQVVESAHE